MSASEIDPASVPSLSKEDLIGEYGNPCPVCGEWCSGLVGFWYVEEQRRKMIEVEGLMFSVCLMTPLVEKAIKNDVYSELPKFVSDWNEGTGWSAFGKFGKDTVVDAADLQKTVDAFLDLQDWTGHECFEFLNAFSEFVAKCLRENRTVYVMEG